MNKKEHNKQLSDLKKIANGILSSEKETKEFLIEVGINTKSGRLTKHYSETRTQIGYKSK